jgi:predicted RNA binding protein YcfA (HicA-like mRNA interferase family)
MSYKRVKVIRTLKDYGFEFLREGSNHTIFTNGNITIPVGRHNEISPKTAQKIAKEIHVSWIEFKSKIN